MRFILRIFSWIGRLVKKLAVAIQSFENRMRHRYNPRTMAFVAIVAIALLMITILFIPPYLGLSNDGSFDSVLLDCGLRRIEPDDVSVYFNYYETTYVIEPATGAMPGTTSPVLRVFIRIAVWIDTLFTGDYLFDVRFLAAIYMIIYLAVLYPFAAGVLGRLRYYSEGLVITVLFVFVFADVTLITRLASLYTYPLELIACLAMIDMSFIIPYKDSRGLAPVLLLLITAIMMLTNRYFAFFGIVMSVGYWAMMTVRKDIIHRIVYSVFAFLLCIFTVFAGAHLLSTQSLNSKYNQMTRGVLFRAENPENALRHFGIEPRYTVLTETYADQQFPLVFPDSGLLDEGFFDQYNTGDIMLYYLYHPVDLVGLLNQGVHKAFITRSDYSGYFEKSEGRPEHAKTAFMTLWSTFKEQTAPQTTAAIIMVFLAFMVLRRDRGLKTNTVEGQREALFKTFWWLFIFLAGVNLLTVVIMSGDSELLRESFLAGVLVDVLFVMFITEILHKINVVKIEEDGR